MKGTVRRARATVQKALDSKVASQTVFSAILTAVDGSVYVQDDPNYCYARIEGRSALRKVLNVDKPAWDGLRVLVGYTNDNPGTLQVVGLDLTSMPNVGDYSFVKEHAKQHILLARDGGNDVVFVRKQMLLPMLVSPTNPASTRLATQKDFYPWAAAWNYWPGGLTVDFVTAVPATDTTYLPLPESGVYVLIAIDGATNTLVYTKGTEFPSWPPPAEATAIPAPSTGTVPLAALYLWAEENRLTNDAGFVTDGFEDPGAGGPDIWAYWTEVVGAGALANDAVIFHGGANSCQTTEGGGGRDTYVYEDIIVEPGDNYQLRFWTRGDGGANDGAYRVYDNTNGADIIAITATGHVAAAWTEIVVVFTVPTTPLPCTSVRIYFYCPAAGASQAWYDDATCARVSLELTWTDLRDVRLLNAPVGGSVSPAVGDWIGLNAANEVSFQPDNPVHYNRNTGVITEYATIQLALNACNVQDAVLVPPGAYIEALTWPAANWVSLIGWGVPGDASGGHSVAITGNCSATLNAYIYGVSITGNFTLNGANAALRMLGTVLTGDVIDGGIPGDLYVETSTVDGDIDVDNLTFWDGRITGTLTVAGVTTHRGAPNMDTVVDGQWVFESLAQLEFTDASTLTINAGQVTRTQAYHKIDTEGAAATDDLDSILGGTEGEIIIIRSVSDTHTIVVKHNIGNIWLIGNVDISLDDINDHIALIRSISGYWCDVGGALGGAGGPHNWFSATHPDTAVQAAARGRIPVGSAVPDWTTLPPGIAHALMKMGAAGLDPGWAAFDWDDIAAAAGADMVHDHSAPIEGDQIDHGNLGGLMDNDHTWYAGLRYVSLLRAGAVTEYADPDDAFTAADTAGDVILVPPGTWTLSAPHTVTNVSVIGLGGGPADCVLQSAIVNQADLVRLQTSGVAYNFSVDWDIGASNGGSHIGIYCGTGTSVYFCASDVDLVAGTSQVYAFWINGAARQCIGHGHGNDGNTSGLTSDGGSIMHCEGTAETDGNGCAYGIDCLEHAANQPIKDCTGYGVCTGASDGHGLNFGKMGGSDVYVAHCYFTGSDYDIIGYQSAAHFYSVKYDPSAVSLVGGATISHLPGDRTSWLRDETITGAWTHENTVDMDGNELILDADGDTSITADVDDQIDVEIGGSDIFVLTPTALRSTGGVAPNLGSTTEAEKIGHAYLALGKDVYPDGEIEIRTGLMRRFVNKIGIDTYTHHRGTGTGVPAGCTLTATPASLWAAWHAVYKGWFYGTYYQHYPNHATLPSGLTVATADPLGTTVLTARIHVTGVCNFGVWFDNFDANRAYIVNNYIYRYDIYLYGNGPETLLYTQTATSQCTAPGVGAAATFAAWVNHAKSGPYGPFCPCGDGIVIRLRFDSGTGIVSPFVIGEQGATSGVGANQTLYDDAWPGTNPYAARRAGTFQRGQGYAGSAWDWYKIDV